MHLVACRSNCSSTASSSGASFSHRRGERETRVTGDEPQGTMGRVQTVARTFSSRDRETSGYEAGSSI